jgi:phosphoribosylglycinamide formyltransferase-1
MNLAIFASGNGSNFQVLAEKIQAGSISAQLSFLFCDKKEAYALKRAEELNVPYFSFELKEFASKEAYEAKLMALLDQHRVDLIILAGYMKIVGSTLLQAYEGKIVNIHPAFLPEFPGAYGIEDAFKAGAPESGVTVHYVNSNVDTGKIIQQVRVPRLESDTLESFEQRIHKAEYELYPKVVKELVERMRK